MTLRRFLKQLLPAFAAMAFAAALAIGPAAVASAEQREVTSQEYKDCIDRGMGVDGAQCELVIEACCIGAGTDSETLKDGNGDAFMCVETVTNRREYVTAAPIQRPRVGAQG